MLHIHQQSARHCVSRGFFTEILSFGKGGQAQEGLEKAGHSENSLWLLNISSYQDSNGEDTVA